MGSSVIGSWRRNRAISSQSSRSIIFFELLCNQRRCLLTLAARTIAIQLGRIYKRARFVVNDLFRLFYKVA